MSPKPVFPCTETPGGAADVKLIGVYPQRQKGLWMQRIKVHGGLINATGWQTLAALARTFTPGTPLLLTTRQCVEFHNITGENLPGLQQKLAAHNFTGLGACGDTLRNMTLCSGNGMCNGSADFSEAAQVTRQVLEDFDNIYNLPRKFKISFSACERFCAQPYINDLGFTASAAGDGRTMIQLIGAGSLGARPTTGIMLQATVSPEDIPAYALAAMRLFDKHGDRENRKKARLRHVRERLGDERFIALFNAEFDACKSLALPRPSVSRSKTHYRLAAELNVPCGLFEPDHADALADCMRSGDVFSRVQNHHRISLFASDIAALGEELQSCGLLQPLLNGPDIVSCPGTAFCSHAIVDTHAAERALREQLPASFSQPLRISGCPNGCSHAGIAPIGLSGRIRKDADGSILEGFQILAGGRMGVEPGCATQHTAFVPTSEIAAFIKNM